MRIKICGITNIQDAIDACEAGADALGFVFYEKSPRFVSAKAASEIIKELPPFVQTVGLFVDTDNIIEICKQASISVAQLHFDNAPMQIDGLQTLKVVRAKEKSDILKFADSYRLVDSFVESYGGAGKRIAIEWFDGIDISKITLAGGLNANNIASIAKLGFYGFDVSSGVESTPGKKDKYKIVDFIQTAKG